jgi:hypothetical protein
MPAPDSPVVNQVILPNDGYFPDGPRNGRTRRAIPRQLQRPAAKEDREPRADAAKHLTSKRSKGLTSTSRTITSNNKKDNHQTMATFTTKTHVRLGLRPAAKVPFLSGTTRGGNLPYEPTHPPQLGVSSAYNPGTFNTSLPITINGHATSALVDSGAPTTVCTQESSALRPQSGDNATTTSS